MTDEPPDEPRDDSESDTGAWNALDILRRRAAASRRARDDSVRELRQHLSDDEILETFGIDLSRLDED